MNGCIEGYADENGILQLEGYKHVRTLTKRPVALKAKTTITRQDEEQNEFEGCTRDIQVIKNLFSSFPEVAKAVGSKRKIK